MVLLVFLPEIILLTLSIYTDFINVKYPYKLNVLKLISNISFLIGGIIFAKRFPENISTPGKFDYIVIFSFLF